MARAAGTVVAAAGVVDSDAALTCSDWKEWRTRACNPTKIAMIAKTAMALPDLLRARRLTAGRVQLPSLDLRSAKAVMVECPADVATSASDSPACCKASPVTSAEFVRIVFCRR